MIGSALGVRDYAECNHALANMGGAYRVYCGSPGEFRGHIHSGRIGPVLLANVQLSRCVVRRDFDSGKAVAEHYNLILQLEGNSRMRQCGSEALLLPGDLTLIDSRFMSEFEATDIIEQRAFAIPAKPVRDLFGRDGVPLARTISGSTGAGRLLADIVTSCCRNSAGLQDLNLIATTMNVLALAAGRCRSPGMLVARQSPDRANIEQFIDANIERHDLGPGLVARHFGLSVRQLYRLTAATGCTPGALIWSRRLARARQLLVEERSASGVLDIALSCGFKDGAHFSRAYRRTFGQSPRESRQRNPAATDGGRDWA
jgi:AraC family transcriptional activator of tynA and feaB